MAGVNIDPIQLEDLYSACKDYSQTVTYLTENMEANVKKATNGGPFENMAGGPLDAIADSIKESFKLIQTSCNHANAVRKVVLASLDKIVEIKKNDSKYNTCIDHINKMKAEMKQNPGKAPSKN